MAARRVLGLALALLAAGGSGASGDEEVDFVRDIQPLLRDHCIECHGANRVEAGLRLDRKDLAMTGGDSGRVIQPSQPDDSRLLKLVRGDDPDRVMPPSGNTLDEEQVELLRRWIAGGARWPDSADGQEPPASREREQSPRGDRACSEEAVTDGTEVSNVCSGSDHGHHVPPGKGVRLPSTPAATQPLH